MRNLMIKVLLLSVVLFNTMSYSQQADCLKKINTQVWSNFTKAFETSDIELFKSIHSPDLIRVSGDGRTIKNYTEYMDSYKQSWNDTSVKRTINFRFLERICDGNFASERGIYELSVSSGNSNKKEYYGKFHVILVQHEELWKLLIDYDSSEDDTINKIDFKEANTIDEIHKY